MTTVDRILEAAGDSTAGVCENVLSIPVMWLPDSPALESTPRLHASIAMMNDQVAMQVGLVAGWDTCAYIVRVMLNLEFDDPLEDQDVTDGIGEMINMVAGQMKTQLNNDFPSLRLAFPMVQAENRRGAQVRSVETASKLLSIGIHDAEVTVMVRKQV